MKTEITIVTSLVYGISFFALITVLMFIFNTKLVHAEGPHGWFVPFGEYMDDNLPPECNPATETAVEINLVDLGTENLIVNPIGQWSVAVYDNSTAVETGWYGYFNGDKTSYTICFDPETEIIAPFIEESTYYRAFHIGPRQPAENYPLTTRGHRFKSFVQLVSTSTPDQSPFVSPVWPTEAMKFEKTPSTYKVATYGEDTLYGAGKDVKTTRIHLTNHDTLEYFTKLSNTPGTTEEKDVPGPTVTTSGIYYWAVEQTMNGTNQTQKSGGPSWTFTGVPMSGGITAACFILDKISPETKIIELYHEMEGSNMEIYFGNEVSDIYAGVESTTIFVEEEDGTLVTTATVNYDPDWETSFDNPWFGAYGLDPDKTYNVYAYTVDLAGNSATSTVISINRLTGTSSAPIVVSPVVTNITDTSAELGATVDETGSSALIETGICWDTNSDFSTERCDATATIASVGIPFTLTPANSMPSGTTIYFRGYAINAVSTGYSSSVNFNTTGPSSLFPSITNLPVIDFTLTTADLRAEVTDEGADSVVKRGTCWNTTGDFSDPPNTANCAEKGGGGLGEFIHSRSGLSSNTTIYYVSYAENSLGDRVYSVSTNFDTKELPAVSLSPASNITDGQAELSAVLSSDGSDTVTAHGFCWSEGSSYNSGSATCEDLGSESAIASFDHTVNSLSSETVYSYIAFAESVAGRFETANQQFTTKPPAGATTFTATPQNINSGESVTLDWNSVNTDTCTGTNFNTGGNTSGTLVLTPASSVTYTLDCTGPGDDTSNVQFVNVIGPPVLTDPELELNSSVAVARIGESVDIEWKMKNISGSMECEVSGPSSLDGDPDATISHPPSPNPGTSYITGTVNSGVLSATQEFTLTCENTADSSDTYSTTTKVRVVGNPLEV